MARITSLTASLSGVLLDRNHPVFVLGQDMDGSFRGVGLAWPSGLSRASVPRLDEIIVIATGDPTDLRALETDAFVPMLHTSGVATLENLSRTATAHRRLGSAPRSRPAGTT